ncbi:unnamed protein product, partial [Heterosigma akashiwo]
MIAIFGARAAKAAQKEAERARKKSKAEILQSFQDADQNRRDSQRSVD